MVFEVHLDFLDQLSVVRALIVQPEQRRHSGGAGAVDRQLDPVANGQVLGLAGAPDIALLDLVLGQHVAVFGDHANNAVFLDLKGLVVGAVLLSFLRHQANVRHRAHGGGIKRAVGLTEVDHFLVDSGVGALRHHRLGVLELVVPRPHLAGVTDHRGHGGIHDDVAGNVQVGNTLHRVHHGNFRAVLVTGVQVFQNLLLLGFRQLLDLFGHAGQSVVGVHAQLVKQVTVLVEQLLVENLHRVTKHNRVGDFHHGRFDVQGEHHAGFFAVFNAVIKERLQRLTAHEHAVQHFTFLQRQLAFQYRLLAFGVFKHNAGVGGFVQGSRLLVGIEITATHVRHVGA